MERNMNHRRRSLSIFAAVAMLVGLVGSTAPLAQARENLNPGVIPPSARPFGHTYGEWSNMFWQWAFSIPVHDGYGNVINPLIDTTGTSQCAVGQTGPAWFLAGLYGVSGAPVRNCTLPAGKGLFIPIFNIENENITWPAHYPPYTLQELRDQMEAVMASLNGCPNCYADIDGVRVQGVYSDADRIGYGNPAFGITIPQDNLFAYIGYPADAGTVYPVVSDGWYLMLAPLPAGQHTVHFGTGPGMDITYHLTVGQ